MTPPTASTALPYCDTFIALSTSEPGRITVQGALDLCTAPQLRVVLGDALLADGANPCVLDLVGLTFIGATGLGVVVGLANRLKAAGGSLVIRGASARTRRVFALVALEDLLGPSCP